MPTIDPALSSDTSSVQVVDSTTVGLTRLEEVTSALNPGMATKWDISADGKSYTFQLRNDVPWVKYDGAKNVVNKVQDCNGADRMVNAYDFQYGILRTLKPETASDYAYVLSFAVAGATDFNSGTVTDTATVGVTVVDTYTLKVDFNEAAAYNANIIGLWVAHAQPSWVIDGSDCTDARGDRWTEPGFFQSYGPFTLKSWIHDSQLSIVKNPFWPGTDAVPQPKVDEVVFSMLDETAAFSEYEAGNLDSTGVPLADIDRVKADPDLSKQYVTAPNLCTYYYGFNTQAPFVDDARVRRALSQSIDRQSLIDNVLKGGQEPAQWFARPGLAAAPTMADHPDLGIKFDVAAANKDLDAYLAEKGLTKDKLDITLMFNTSSGHQKIAEAIQQMWKTNLGVDIKVTNQEWKVFLKTIRDPIGTPQIYRLGWCQDYPDANNFTREVFIKGGSANPTEGGGINWQNDTFQEIVLKAAVEADPAKRLELYAQAEDILVNTDAAIAPIYWYTRNTVTKPYVVRTFSASGHESYEKWDITQ
ncbi:peptide ABC transporter substrate-binding protein [Candidatus Amarolinea dominans]|uniref:peptide ABC transporter substrate-binding protein n=1 Tax=Candidatus Amarolinea dominans TaxID=3140696 RepID=UPI001DBD2726|nr:peptide ABC transporter substrate-binding protein [Anaerolineae bacterium]